MSWRHLASVRTLRLYFFIDVKVARSIWIALAGQLRQYGRQLRNTALVSWMSSLIPIAKNHYIRHKMSVCNEQSAWWLQMANGGGGGGYVCLYSLILVTWFELGPCFCGYVWINVHISPLMVYVCKKLCLLFSDAESQQRILSVRNGTTHLSSCKPLYQPKDAEVWTVSLVIADGN